MLTILLTMSLSYSHGAKCSIFATSSWNFDVAWEYCVFVDEPVLDAILWFSANQNATMPAPLAVVCFKKYVF